MDYSSHYMIPPQPHMTSNAHLSALQWANAAAEGAHHTSLLQHCSEYQQQQQQQQQQQLETGQHQDQRPHLLQQRQKQTKSTDTHEDFRDSKRPAPSMSAQEELANSETFLKRPRLEQQQQQQTSNVPFKMQVRKEKLGERITALQQLVSPFGKTDTASVLYEAIGYIKFLQDQVQVLSTPYMKSNVGPSSMHHDDGNKMGWSKLKSDDARQDLRSRGLCLVPVSCTLQVANDNGADFWTPAIGGSCR